MEELFSIVVSCLVIVAGIALKVTKNEKYNSFKRYWHYFVISGIALIILKFLIIWIKG
jgi:hypothetical protein